MARAQLVELARLGEPLERVLADRLEHAEARLAVGALALADEALVDERGDAVEHLAELEPERLAATVSAVSSDAAADEDAEAREQRLLAVVEQVVAPVDRVPQRRWRVGRSRRRR